DGKAVRIAVDTVSDIVRTASGIAGIAADSTAVVHTAAADTAAAVVRTAAVVESNADDDVAGMHVPAGGLAAAAVAAAAPSEPAAAPEAPAAAASHTGALDTAGLPGNYEIPVADGSSDLAAPFAVCLWAAELLELAAAVPVATQRTEDSAVPVERLRTPHRFQTGYWPTRGQRDAAPCHRHHHLPYRRRQSCMSLTPLLHCSCTMMPLDRSFRTDLSRLRSQRCH
ncbi:hypothetical protein Vafri_13953, partial [Volvox africanus]